MDPPKPLADLISTVRKMDRCYLELVAPPSENTGFALVKIRSKVVESAKARERRVRQIAARKNREQKEVQLSWHTDSGDMEHKLSSIREHILGGVRVDVVFAHKKNQPELTPAQMETKVAEMVAAIADVAREWLPRESMKKMTIVHLQSIDRPLSPRMIAKRQNTIQSSS